MEYDSDKAGSDIPSDSEVVHESSDETQQSDNPTSSEDECDPEYLIFPVSFEQADPMCIRLNTLITQGKIPKDKILYKFLNDVVHILLDPRHEYDSEVVEFFNTINYLGGLRTVNFVRGPMWHGTGKGGEKDAEMLSGQLNLGGPSRPTMMKSKSGYITSSGIVKEWLQSLLVLSKDPDTQCTPLLDNDSLSVFPACLQNDGTPLKASILYDDKQKVCVGLKETKDINFVKQNPNPDPEYLKENVVTEANVNFVTHLDNMVSLPIGVHYKTKAGKTGEDMMAQFLEDIRLTQTCLSCLQKTECPSHIVNTRRCNSVCNECLDSKGVCETCTQQGQASHLPPLRACSTCVENGEKCVKIAVLVLSSDSESGNKNAFETILKQRADGTLNPEFIFLPMLDVVHMGKSLKGSFSCWVILLNGERACLSILRTLRDTDPQYRKLIPRDSVIHKDRMDFNCILHLTKPQAIEHLKSVDQIVHTIVPDKYKISDTNKVGLYPHPIAIDIGEDGRLYVLNYKPMQKRSTVLKIRLHNPAEVNTLGEFANAHTITYLSGVVFVCEANSCIHVIPVKREIQINISKLRTKDSVRFYLEEFNLDTNGTKVQMTDLLKSHLLNVKNSYIEKGCDLTTLILDENIPPSCVGKLVDSPNTLICASDSFKVIYSVHVEFDGVAVKGTTSVVCPYVSLVNEVRGICHVSSKNALLISFVSESGGGIAKVCLETSETTIIIANDSLEISAGIAAIDHPVYDAVFCDPSSHTISGLDSNGNTHVIAGIQGEEGNNDGRALLSKFGQPMGICIENNKNLFVTDAQTGCIKLITSLSGTVSFLDHLGLLYKSFNVHFKGQKYQVVPIDEACRQLEKVAQYFTKTSTDVSPHPTNGPDGTIAHKALQSLEIIVKGIKDLRDLLQQINPQYPIHLHSCLTCDVENLHAVGHLKEQMPAQLHYCQNLFTTVYESIKRVVQWAAFYFTHPSSYYPVPEHKINLKQIPRLTTVENPRVLSKDEVETMREWAATHGKCVRQRSIREETTKYRCGTLPLNMYGKKPMPVKDMERVNLSLSTQVVDVESDDDSDKSEVEDQQSEYDSDSEVSDEEISRSEVDDIRPAMGPVMTRSGRTVRVPLKYRQGSGHD